MTEAPERVLANDVGFYGSVAARRCGWAACLKFEGSVGVAIAIEMALSPAVALRCFDVDGHHGVRVERFGVARFYGLAGRIRKLDCRRLWGWRRTCHF